MKGVATGQSINARLKGRESTKQENLWQKRWYANLDVTNVITGVNKTMGHSAEYLFEIMGR